MARASEDLPSPVDEFVPPPPPPAAPQAPPAYAAPGVSCAPAPPGAPYTPYYPYGHPVRQNNVLAIISLVASLVGLFVPFADVAGIVMGHIALGQIKRTGEGGRGMALAGVIVGYVVIGFSLIGIAIWSSSLPS